MRKSFPVFLLIILVLLMLVGCSADQNRAPIVKTNERKEITVCTGDTVRFNLRFEDPDGDNVSVTVEASNDFLVDCYDKITGIFEWTDAGPGGNYFVEFTGFDGEAITRHQVIIIVKDKEDETGDNKPPELVSSVKEEYKVAENGNLKFNVIFEDPDGDSLDVRAESNQYQLVQAFDKNSGLFDWNVNLPAGKYTVTFIASDGKANTSIEVKIIVLQNEPPVIEKIGNKIISPNETLEFVVRAHDPDGEDSRIRYMVDDLKEYFNEDGVFKWKNIGEELSGKVYSLTFTAIDELGETASEQIVIKINSIPEFDEILLNGVVVDETETLQFFSGRENRLEIKASDKDGDRINIEITEIGGTGELDINNFVFNEDNKTGIISWAPTSDRIDDEISITFKVTDYPGDLYDIDYTSSDLLSLVIKVVE
ncbi:MAG TPA: hypothetical protein PKM10_07770 [Halanaerobiales bacterium]|nr:hypothetical protein [Halanaerobiales bacterium]